MTRQATTLFSSADLQVLDVLCACVAGRADDEEAPAFEVVLPTSGVFRRRTSGGTALIDASVAYAGVPGGGQHVEHLSAGDRCIAVLLSERLADELGVSAAPCVPRPPVHDRLVASARRNVVEESWLTMLDALLHGTTPPPRISGGHRRAVEDVRAALAAEPGSPWTLRTLATIAGYAPHHLSRVFRAVTGTTVTEHRDRIRLGRAAELVADGMPLADVAASLGFADHGHLTRRARHVLGVPPSQLRR